MQSEYTYRAIVVRVYDGDTINADVDLGFSIWMKKTKFRLSRINTPEIRGQERKMGLKARDWLRQQILNKPVIISTRKDRKGKYGRWLADIWLDGVCINDELVKQGFADYV